MKDWSRGVWEGGMERAERWGLAGRGIRKARLAHLRPRPAAFYWMVPFLVILLVETGTPQSLSLNNFLMTGPKAHLAFAESVAAGAHASMEECRFQFRWDRWDCPRSATSVFSGRQTRASREVAFVQAISAAGVVYTLTRNCSLGDIEKCGCDNSKKGQRGESPPETETVPSPATSAKGAGERSEGTASSTVAPSNGGVNWKWGGCSDNIRFGERISKLFVDALETGTDARATVNLHNNEAGRRAVRRTMRLLCKCHGVSGACTTKTCWQQLADLRTIGSFLRRKHDRAIKVDFHNGVMMHKAANALKDIPRIRKTDLVYLEKSPDYCKKNQSLNVGGTLGRECSMVKNGEKASKQERRSCKVLCTSCGFQIRKVQVEVRTKCNCKFIWCCEVKCQICDVTKDIYTCTL